MTKKEFREYCDIHQYGRKRGQVRIAIYFGWKTGELPDGKMFGGYKYMVKAQQANHKTQDLMNILYDWVHKEVQPPYTVEYKYAETDEKRFKVSLSG